MSKSLLMMTLLFACLLMHFKGNPLMINDMFVFASDDENDTDDNDNDHDNNNNNDNNDDCSTMNIILGTRSFIEGTECDDTIIGAPVAAISGGSGSALGDTLRGLERHDILQGSVSDDKLYGDEGNDQLTASDGIDQLYGGPGNDVLQAGSGVE